MSNEVFLDEFKDFFNRERMTSKKDTALALLIERDYLNEKFKKTPKKMTLMNDKEVLEMVVIKDAIEAGDLEYLNEYMLKNKYPLMKIKNMGIFEYSLKHGHVLTAKFLESNLISMWFVDNYDYMI